MKTLLKKHLAPLRCKWNNSEILLPFSCKFWLFTSLVHRSSSLEWTHGVRSYQTSIWM